MKPTISKLIIAFLLVCWLKVEATGLSDLTAMYNVYQGATDLGDHGFTIDFDRYSWEKQWSYGGNLKYIKTLNQILRQTAEKTQMDVNSLLHVLNVTF